MLRSIFGDDEAKHRGKRGEIIPQPHEGLPDSDRPSGLCPRCTKQTSFQAIGSLPVTFQKDVFAHGRDGSVSNPHVEQATVLICRHCSHGVVVVEEQHVGGVHYSKSNGGVVAWRGIHWWPLPDTVMSQDIPGPIASAFSEAARSLSSQCPRAAAVMARRTLEAVADQYSATGANLAARLQWLASNGRLHSTLADWAKEVRLVGNRGAHFDPIQDVSLEDARDLIAFVRELLKYLYELPADLARRRQNASP